MEGCLKEISETRGDDNVRLARLEADVLRHVDAEDGREDSDRGVRRRGVVLCDSDEVADALLRWMNRSSASLAALNPAKLSLPSRQARTGECFTATDEHNVTSRSSLQLATV